MHESARGLSASEWISSRKGGIRMRIGYSRLNMEGKRNTCAPECIKKGGRGLEIPFPNERASSGEDSANLSDGEDEPQTLDDRVLLCVADRKIQEGANTEQGCKDDKPTDRWEASGWIVFLECHKDG